MIDFRVPACALSVCAAVVMLAGCGGAQPSLGVPNTGNNVSDAGNHRTCRGSHHVRANPCPIKLKDPSGGVATISGPGVVNSRVSPCDPYSHICTVSQIDGTHWQVNPGYACGQQHLPVTALNGNGDPVGTTRLYIRNGYCP